MDYKIRKEVIHAGKEFKPIGNGSKVYFHFQTKLCDQDETLIDDSHKLGKPMELVLGKKFKLEVWETIVQAMAVGEIAKFSVDKSLVGSYPFVSKTLRDAGKPNSQRVHCCGTTLQNQGIGHEDLNQLIKEPQDLQFVIELLKVENAGEYERESWQLSEDEKLAAVPRLREQGNLLYQQKQYQAAADKYAEAIGYIEQLLLKEKPRDVEWNDLNAKKLPLLLNYAQCKLLLKDYYPVIEHCSTVLEFEPENVKALFRRGKAHGAVWNMKEAKEDLERAAELDPSLGSTVRATLSSISTTVKQRDAAVKEQLAGKMF
ncbi:AH receptor-interacting protein-like [Macrosteles quadrilineatus]|uniref:AH receptor-interacting protein-like n=1 Tax=Macrosteles quadrilineatus TaxID=74068 RepID=UPI0023E30C0D|nr:AH receptor-interacting protein-like [Macrosteles quadrilineatus]XP_054274522.1 AH receptor-interacting protein-like [Macrosteles quadrilineatus]